MEKKVCGKIEELLHKGPLQKIKALEICFNKLTDLSDIDNAMVALLFRSLEANIIQLENEVLRMKNESKE